MRFHYRLVWSLGNVMEKYNITPQYLSSNNVPTQSEEK